VDHHGSGRAGVVQDTKRDLNEIALIHDSRRAKHNWLEENVSEID
jgi:hypothetical protein